MMNNHPFIFSDKKRYRLERHLIFWTAWCLFQVLLYSTAPLNNTCPYFLRLKIAVPGAIVYMISHMFLSYSLMYFVIPRFLLKQKYWPTAFWSVLLILLTGLIAGILSFTIIEKINAWIIGSTYVKTMNEVNAKVLYMSFMAGLRGGLSIGGIAATIKLMKFWYIKEQRNLQLQKENMAAQLQLLKAQVHPHFLFNTLNNIYSYTQKVSPTASTLVMGLSDLMRYILHEGSRQSVPLSKELKMINDYITLEQVRYGNSLDINKELPEDTTGLHIAPLLLLPFVENCFKHGASRMLEQPWIRLAIHIDGNRMKMMVANAKFSGPVNNEPVSGIGIANVKKRLELLYPEKHQLTITVEEDVYIVNLTVELENISVVTIIKEAKELSYA